MPAAWGAALLKLDTARLLQMPANPAGLGTDEALPESLRRFLAEVGTLVLGMVELMGGGHWDRL